MMMKKDEDEASNSSSSRRGCYSGVKTLCFVLLIFVPTGVFLDQVAIHSEHADLLTVKLLFGGGGRNSSSDSSSSNGTGSSTSNVLLGMMSSSSNTGNIRVNSNQKSVIVKSSNIKARNRNTSETTPPTTQQQRIRNNATNTRPQMMVFSKKNKQNQSSSVRTDLRSDFYDSASSSKNNKDKDMNLQNFKGSNNTTQFSTKDLHAMAQQFPDAPKEDDDNILAVYSREAVQRLKQIMQKAKKNGPITLVMNGGSSSAFIPFGKQEDRFFKQLVHAHLEPNWEHSNITIVDRAHGARNTVHSAHLMPSFLPKGGADIVLWEFSINDGHRAEDVRNSLILWLRNVAASSAADGQPPPLVILVYLWSSPFSVDNSTNKIPSRTYDQHAMLGAEYDFVLGHVNVAAYFDATLKHWSEDELKASFLGDRHHPTDLAHHIIAKLLWQLMSRSAEEESSFTPVREQHQKVPTGSSSKTNLTWSVCRGTKDQDKKRDFIDMFEATGGIAKASFTVDEPRNSKQEQSPAKALVPLRRDGKNFTVLHYGKEAPERLDRQRGLVIPRCCDNISLAFDTHHQHVAMMSGILLALRCPVERKSDLRMIVSSSSPDDDKNNTTWQPADLIDPWQSWRCLMGGYNMNIGDFKSLDASFVVLKPRKNVTSLRFCDSKCDEGKRDKGIPLVYISVF